MSEVWTINEYVQKGWQCLVCGKVNAPWMMQCTCDGNKMGIQYSDHTSIPEVIPVRRTCGMCDKTDGYMYTSNPPKYRCTITGKWVTGNTICDAGALLGGNIDN